MTTRILLADDQAAIRSAFRIILDAQPDMTVVGEAPDGLSAIAQARHLRPDVLLADIQMPGLDGIEVTRQLAPHTRVVIVTTFDLDEYVDAALRKIAEQLHLSAGTVKPPRRGYPQGGRQQPGVEVATWAWQAGLADSARALGVSSWSTAG